MGRYTLVAITLAGLFAGVFVVGSIGFAPVLAAVAAIGWVGFSAFVAYSLLVLTVLALAWQVVAPDTPGGYRAFLFGRIMREAASETLPFSQLGGIVLGTRLVIRAGIAEALVVASLIADITLELVAQLVYTLFGIAMLATLMMPGRDMRVFILSCEGLGVTAAALGLLIAGQKTLLTFSDRLFRQLLPNNIISFNVISDILDNIYRTPVRVLSCFLLHIVTWFAAGAGAWIALAFARHPLALDHVLAIEALIFAVRAIAFFVPGALGVQEGAYLLIGPIFGLSPRLAIALSLIKRARELAIGVPTLLIWQGGEVRAARRSSPAPAPPTGVESRMVRFADAIEPPQREWYISGTAQAFSAPAPATAQRPHITNPVSGSIFALDPDISVNRQRLGVRVAGPVTGHRITLDAHDVGDAAAHPLISPLPGSHLLALVDPRGAVIDQVRFTVR